MRFFLLIVAFFLITPSPSLSIANGNNLPVFYPPFEKGKSYLVVQGFFGNKTHNSKLDYYAIDLAMPVGDKVCAAETGEVIGFRNNSKGSRYANYLYLLHPSGLITDYHHLRAGFQVHIGKKIKRGECFAESGNTGFSSGAHLHFAVLKMDEVGDGASSIPFRIASKGQATLPESFAWVDH